MKIDKRIKSYNKKNKEELEKAIKTIEPFLIQAFTNFYGKQYQEQIKNTIKSIYFTYFLSLDFFKLVDIKSLCLSKKDQRSIIYYLHYLNKFYTQIKGINDLEGLEKAALKKVIVKSAFSDQRLINSNFLEYLSNDVPMYFIIADEEEEHFYKSIFLPLLVIDLETIIHEINHALMIDIMAVTEEEFVMPSLFITEACEELINDYIARLVLKEYIQMKAPIPSVLRKFDFVNAYEIYSYLIEPFFHHFEPIIKESIMTKNFNLLKMYAGKDDFALFCSLVQEYYLQDGCTKEEYSALKTLVLKMADHAASMTNPNYEEYFHELENKGFRIRKLK